MLYQLLCWIGFPIVIFAENTSLGLLRSTIYDILIRLVVYIILFFGVQILGL